MLAHGGNLALTYPDSEQRPKRGYPLASHPLHHLARLTSGSGLGLTYPDGEQRAKRGYPLGSHPLHHLARAASSAPPPSPVNGGGAAYYDWKRDLKPDWDDDEEVLELMSMITPYL